MKKLALLLLLAASGSCLAMDNLPNDIETSFGTVKKKLLEKLNTICNALQTHMKIIKFYTSVQRIYRQEKNTIHKHSSNDNKAKAKRLNKRRKECLETIKLLDKNDIFQFLVERYKKLTDQLNQLQYT